MLPLCRDAGVAVMPWSPLARGRLTRDWDATSARGDSRRAPLDRTDQRCQRRLRRDRPQRLGYLECTGNGRAMTQLILDGRASTLDLAAFAPGRMQPEPWRRVPRTRGSQ